MGTIDGPGVEDVVLHARQEAYGRAYRTYERALRSFERIRGVYRDPSDLSAYRAAEERIVRAEEALDRATAALGSTEE